MLIAHVSASSLCPQCDANFTRVRSLESRAARAAHYVKCEFRPMPSGDTRSHGKNPFSEPSFEGCLRNYYRHNGVVIEPPKQPRRSTSIPSPTDGSGPSRSPSMAEPEAGPSRSQSEPYSAGSLVPRVAVRGNYYREHTMSPGAILLLPQSVQFLKIHRIRRSATTS